MTTTPTQSTAPSSRPRRRYGLAIAAALFAMLAVVAVLPDLVRLDRYSPFSQLVAFRPVIAAAAAVAAVVLGLLAIKVHWLWPFAATLAVVVAVAAVLVVPRTLADQPPTQGRQYTVLSFNAYYGRADAAALAELIRTQRPDFVSLPETGPSFRGRLAPLVTPLGYRILYTDAFGRSEVAGITALVADRLGDVAAHPGDNPSFPNLELTGGALGELRLVAVHPHPPLPSAVQRWRDNLAALPAWCAGDKPAIIAGDLNATLDHSELRAAMQGCADAADQSGAGLIGTWPSNRPRWLGPQIDHVLVTNGIVAQSFEVFDLPGSDHRAIVTRVVVP